MIKAIANFINYDVNKFSPEEIRTEFTHKYSNSWLYINGALTLISKLDIGNRILYGHALDKTPVVIRKIESIAHFKPKTGLYQSDEALIYLYRVPERQWIKSFSLHNNYQIFYLAGNEPNLDVVPTFITNPETEYYKETAIFKNKVFLHWKEVGTYQNGKIYITNRNFEKEIKELWPQFPSTLDAPPQKKYMDEKLILDF